MSYPVNTVTVQDAFNITKAMPPGKLAVHNGTNFVIDHVADPTAVLGMLVNLAATNERGVAGRVIVSILLGLISDIEDDGVEEFDPIEYKEQVRNEPR